MSRCLAMLLIAIAGVGSGDRLIPLNVAIAALVSAEDAQSAAQSRLTVDDVLRMIEVKLAEDLIISQVRKNARPFSLSADDMIRLKAKGASDELIRVMLDPNARPNSRVGPVASTALTPRSSSVLPTAYGLYLLEGDKLHELVSVPVITKFGLTIGNRGFAVDGLSDEQPSLRIGSRTPIILVYQQNVVPGTLQLRQLAFVDQMQAYQFNILGTAPQFFGNVYRKNPNETIPINLLRPNRAVELRIEPVEGKSDMFKLVPGAALQAGKYALYFQDALHEGTNVFSASLGRQAVAFSFEVVGSQTEVLPGTALESAPGIPARSVGNVTRYRSARNLSWYLELRPDGTFTWLREECTQTTGGGAVLPCTPGRVLVRNFLMPVNHAWKGTYEIRGETLTCTVSLPGEEAHGHAWMSTINGDRVVESDGTVWQRR